MLNSPRAAQSLSRFALLLVLASVMSACSSLKPYSIPIVQGNVVTREQVQALKPGMSRLQVKEILGTPLVSSVFRANRWDYVFTLKQQGVDPQARRVTVYFVDDVLDHFDADPLPSEPEFVASMFQKETPKVPVLEASPEQLQKFPGPKAQAAPSAVLPPLPATYPPLEPYSSR